MAAKSKSKKTKPAPVKQVVNLLIPTNTLRPGLLVNMKTSITGNVEYSKKDLEFDHVAKDGTRKARWETQRVILDPKEYAAACEVRNKARTAIRRVCKLSSFGLLCPESDSDELAKSIAEARRLAEDFNKKSKVTSVHFYIIAGKIAQDDVEAIKAIKSEVRDLLAEMKEGVENLDVKSVRDAAARAKNIAAMLSPDAAARVQVAVEAARTAATNIVKAGEQAAQEIDRRAIRAISESRTAFLDLDDEAKSVVAPKASGRAIDLVPDAGDDAAKPVKKTRASRAIEMEV